MKATDDIRRFLESLELGPRSRYSYVTCLRAFRTLCAERAPSIETVREWLNRDAARSPLPNVVERAAVISRYLTWRAVNRAASNPIADLKAQYGGRLTPIVRALLEDNYQSALEGLRPLPAWGSAQGQLMREHIARMRSLGYKYEVRARDLRRFDRYLQRHGELADRPLEAQLAAWRRTLRTPRHELRVEQCARTLTQALHRRDLSLPIVAVTRGLQRRVERAERKPHLFTEVEIERLYQAARTFPGRNTPHRPLMVEAMLTLAYCAGLRLGEIAALTLADVDREDRLIEIRDTKFFKSRRLPLAPSVMQVLERYLAARQTARAPGAPEAPLWWSPLRRKGYSYGEIQKLLTRVIRLAGLKPARGRRGPHVHDLRHAFVAHRMLKWYRNGVDPQSRLPHLATYLGHKDILSTLVYLNITPELLEQASERYRRRGAAALDAGDRP